MSKKTGIIKLTNVITLVAFVINIFANDSFAFKNTYEVKNDNTNKVTVPSALASIEEISIVDSKNPIVFYIQDMHSNYYAQTATTKIIDYLNKNYNAKTVLLEGAKGRYDLSVFRNIQDKKIRAKTADYFLKSGDIDAAEYYAALNEDMQLLGIEDTKLYIENLNTYRDSLNQKLDVNKILYALSDTIEKLKLKNYSKELLELDRKRKEFDSGKIELQNYLAFLKEVLTKYNVDIFGYKNISSISSIIKNEANINFNNIDTQLHGLIDKIKANLSKTEADEFDGVVVDYSSGTLSKKDFYLYVKKFIGLLSNQSKSSYKNIISYIDIACQYENIDPIVLFKELEQIEDAIFSKLSNNNTITVKNLDKSLVLLNKLFYFKLIPEEYDLIKKEPDRILLSNFSLYVDRDKLDILESYKSTVLAFYEYSEKRDEVFINNIANEIEKQKTAQSSHTSGNINRNIMLIAGGFHKINLIEQFKKENINYCILKPTFQAPKDYTSPYFQLLSGKQDPVQNFLLPAFNLKIASKLSELASDVFDKANIDSFEAAVKLVSMLHKEDSGCIIVEKKHSSDRILLSLINGTTRAFIMDDIGYRMWSKRYQKPYRIITVEDLLYRTQEDFVETRQRQYTDKLSSQVLLKYFYGTGSDGFGGFMPILSRVSHYFRDIHARQQILDKINKLFQSDKLIFAFSKDLLPGSVRGYLSMDGIVIELGLSREDITLLENAKTPVEKRDIYIDIIRRMAESDEQVKKIAGVIIHEILANIIQDHRITENVYLPSTQDAIGRALFAVDLFHWVWDFESKKEVEDVWDWRHTKTEDATEEERVPFEFYPPENASKDERLAYLIVPIIKKLSYLYALGHTPDSLNDFLDSEILRYMPEESQREYLAALQMLFSLLRNGASPSMQYVTLEEQKDLDYLKEFLDIAKTDRKRARKILQEQMEWAEQEEIEKEREENPWIDSVPEIAQYSASAIMDDAIFDEVVESIREAVIDIEGKLANETAYLEQDLETGKKDEFDNFKKYLSLIIDICTTPGIYDKSFNKLLYAIKDLGTMPVEIFFQKGDAFDDFVFSTAKKYQLTPFEHFILNSIATMDSPAILFKAIKEKQLKEALGKSILFSTDFGSSPAIDPGISDTNEGGFSRYEHLAYHEHGRFEKVISQIYHGLIASGYVIPVTMQDQKPQYDFRSLFHDDPAKVIQTSHGYLKLEYDEYAKAYILVIVDDRFQASHAGRGRYSVYARDDAKSIHELTELKLWAIFALDNGIATQQQIQQGYLGDIIREWSNGTGAFVTDSITLLARRDIIIRNTHRYHQEALKAEAKYLIEKNRSILEPLFPKNTHVLNPDEYFNFLRQNTGDFEGYIDDLRQLITVVGRFNLSFDITDEQISELIEKKFRIARATIKKMQLDTRGKSKYVFVTDGIVFRVYYAWPNRFFREAWPFYAEKESYEYLRKTVGLEKAQRLVTRIVEVPSMPILDVLEMAIPLDKIYALLQKAEKKHPQEVEGIRDLLIKMERSNPVLDFIESKPANIGLVARKDPDGIERVYLVGFDLAGFFSSERAQEAQRDQKAFRKLFTDAQPIGVPLEDFSKIIPEMRVLLEARDRFDVIAYAENYDERLAVLYRAESSYDFDFVISDEGSSKGARDYLSDIFLPYIETLRIRSERHAIVPLFGDKREEQNAKLARATRNVQRIKEEMRQETLEELIRALQALGMVKKDSEYTDAQRKALQLIIAVLRNEGLLDEHSFNVLFVPPDSWLCELPVFQMVKKGGLFLPLSVGKTQGNCAFIIRMEGDNIVDLVEIILHEMLHGKYGVGKEKLVASRSDYSPLLAILDEARTESVAQKIMQKISDTNPEFLAALDQQYRAKGLGVKSFVTEILGDPAIEPSPFSVAYLGEQRFLNAILVKWPKKGERAVDAMLIDGDTKPLEKLFGENWPTLIKFSNLFIENGRRSPAGAVLIQILADATKDKAQRDIFSMAEVFVNIMQKIEQACFFDEILWELSERLHITLDHETMVYKATDLEEKLYLSVWQVLYENRNLPANPERIWMLLREKFINIFLKKFPDITQDTSGRTETIAEIFDEKYQLIDETLEELDGFSAADPGISDTGTGGFTRQEHLEYHQSGQFQEVIESINEELTQQGYAIPTQTTQDNEQRYNFRKLFKDDPNKVIKTSHGYLKLEYDEYSKNYILVIVDDRFQASHAGRGQFAVYATTGAKTVHEITELELWAKFAIERNIATRDQIEQNQLGHRIRDWTNGTGEFTADPATILSRQQEVAKLVEAYHEEALKKEAEFIIKKLQTYTTNDVKYDMNAVFDSIGKMGWTLERFAAGLTILEEELKERIGEITDDIMVRALEDYQKRKMSFKELAVRSGQTLSQKTKTKLIAVLFNVPEEQIKTIGVPGNYKTAFLVNGVVVRVYHADWFTFFIRMLTTGISEAAVANDIEEIVGSADLVPRIAQIPGLPVDIIEHCLPLDIAIEKAQTQGAKGQWFIDLVRQAKQDNVLLRVPEDNNRDLGILIRDEGGGNKRAYLVPIDLGDLTLHQYAHGYGEFSFALSKTKPVEVPCNKLLELIPELKELDNSETAFKEALLKINPESRKNTEARAEIQSDFDFAISDQTTRVTLLPIPVFSQKTVYKGAIVDSSGKILGVRIKTPRLTDDSQQDTEIIFSAERQHYDSELLLDDYFDRQSKKHIAYNSAQAKFLNSFSKFCKKQKPRLFSFSDMTKDFFGGVDSQRNFICLHSSLFDNKVSLFYLLFQLYLEKGMMNISVENQYNELGKITAVNMSVTLCYSKIDPYFSDEVFIIGSFSSETIDFINRQSWPPDWFDLSAHGFKYVNRVVSQELFGEWDDELAYRLEHANKALVENVLQAIDNIEEPIRYEPFEVAVDSVHIPAEIKDGFGGAPSRALININGSKIAHGADSFIEVSFSNNEKRKIYVGSHHHLAFYILYHAHKTNVLGAKKIWVRHIDDHGDDASNYVAVPSLKSDELSLARFLGSERTPQTIQKFGSTHKAIWEGNYLTALMQSGLLLGYNWYGYPELAERDGDKQWFKPRESLVDTGQIPAMDVNVTDIDLDAASIDFEFIPETLIHIINLARKGRIAMVFTSPSYIDKNFDYSAFSETLTNTLIRVYALDDLFAVSPISALQAMEDYLTGARKIETTSLSDGRNPDFASMLNIASNIALRFVLRSMLEEKKRVLEELQKQIANVDIKAKVDVLLRRINTILESEKIIKDEHASRSASPFLRKAVFKRMAGNKEGFIVADIFHPDREHLISIIDRAGFDQANIQRNLVKLAGKNPETIEFIKHFMQFPHFHPSGSLEPELLVFNNRFQDFLLYADINSVSLLLHNSIKNNAIAQFMAIAEMLCLLGYMRIDLDNVVYEKNTNNIQSGRICVSLPSIASLDSTSHNEILLKQFFSENLNKDAKQFINSADNAVIWKGNNRYLIRVLSIALFGKAAISLEKQIQDIILEDSEEQNVQTFTADPGISDTGTGGFTREEHLEYHESGQFQEVIESINEELTQQGYAIPTQTTQDNEQRYNFRKLFKDDPNKVIKTSHGYLKLEYDEYSKNYILVIVDDRFQASHAGRGQYAVYAKTEAKAIHEITELKLWAKFAIERNIATRDQIQQNQLGHRIRDWSNGTGDFTADPATILSRQQEIARLATAYHQEALKKEAEFIIKGLPPYSYDVGEKMPDINQLFERAISMGHDLNVLVSNLQNMSDFVKTHPEATFDIGEPSGMDLIKIIAPFISAEVEPLGGRDNSEKRAFLANGVVLRIYKGEWQHYLFNLMPRGRSEALAHSFIEKNSPHGNLSARTVEMPGLPLYVSERVLTLEEARAIISERRNQQNQQAIEQFYSLVTEEAKLHHPLGFIADSLNDKNCGFIMRTLADGTKKIYFVSFDLAGFFGVEETVAREELQNAMPFEIPFELARDVLGEEVILQIEESERAFNAALEYIDSEPEFETIQQEIQSDFDFAIKAEETKGEDQSFIAASLANSTKELLTLRDRTRIHRENEDGIVSVVVLDDISRLEKIEGFDHDKAMQMKRKMQFEAGVAAERLFSQGRCSKIIYVSSAEEALAILGRLGRNSQNTFFYVEKTVCEKEQANFEALKKQAMVFELNIPKGSLCAITPLGFITLSSKLHDLIMRKQRGEDIEAQKEDLARIILSAQNLSFTEQTNRIVTSSIIEPLLDALRTASDIDEFIVLCSRRAFVIDVPSACPQNWNDVQNYIEALKQMYESA